MNKTNHSSRRKSAISVALTIAIILSLALTAPASAVQLSMSLDTTDATEGDVVGFNLGLDIESGERVPFESVTVNLAGPENVTCVFALDGTPISGCEGFSIFQTNDLASYEQGNRYGYGFDGTSTYGTNFGYGYGYGYAFDSVGPSEFFWRVEWDTTGATPGDYETTFYATASNGVTRTFNVEEAQTLTINSAIIPGAMLSIDGEPDNTITEDQMYTFRCTDNFGADSFDFDFGDGNFVFDSTTNTAPHAYSESGTYVASCTAFDEQTSTARTGTLEVVVTESGSVCTPTAEVCDGMDNNCNGVVDEGGVCGGPVCTPSAEVCDGMDNDCDGIIDEGNACPSPSGTNLVVTDIDGGTVSFDCTNTIGATAFDWNFGDGTMLIDVPQQQMTHTYSSSGTYVAYCAATNGGATADDTTTVTVSVDGTSVPDSGAVNLHIKSPFPQGNNYTFVCENNFGAETYDWEITHVESGVREYLQYDIENKEIWHTMRRTGEYFISCSATRDATTVSDSMTASNSIVFEQPNEPPAEQQPGVFATVVMGNGTTTLVVPSGANQDIRVVVPEGVTDVRVDLTDLLLNVVGETRAFMPVNAVFDSMASAGVEVTVPAGISIYSSTAWDGILTLPQLTTNTATLPPGAVPGVVIEIGSSLPIEFDKGVRILFAGRAGENVVYVKDNVTTEINATCSADTQAAADALAPAGDCKIDVGSDLVVWTKHFTTFVTYTQAASEEAPASSSRGGGRTVMTYGARAPASEPEEPADEPVSEPVVEQETPVDAADDTQLSAREPAEEPAELTGLVSGSDAGGIPAWFKAAALLTIIVAVVASIVVRVRRQ